MRELRWCTGAGVKPRIFFRGGYWRLMYHQRPRMMSLFGADAAQRLRIRKLHVMIETCADLQHAYGCLQTRYLDGLVERDLALELPHDLEDHYEYFARMYRVPRADAGAEPTVH